MAGKEIIMYRGEDCGLRGYRVKCGEGMHLHHLISRQQTRGAKRASEYVEENAHIFKAWVCGIHNAGVKLADSPEGRALLFEKKRKQHGEGKVRRYLDVLRSKYKLTRHDLNYDAIMAYLPSEVVLISA